MIFKRLLIIYCICLFFSCTENKTITGSITEISIANPLNKSDEIIFSDLIQKINIIFHPQIQTQPLVNPYKILYTSNKLYLLDGPTKKLFVYDSQGYLVFEIESDPGPESPAELRDFFVEQDGTLYLLSYGEILKFNAYGEFLFRKKLNYNSKEIDYVNPTQFTKSENNFYLWGGTTGIENFRKPVYTLYKLDTNFTITDRYLPTSRKLIESYRFQNNKEEVLVSPLLGVDSIYAINNGLVAAHYFVNFHKYKIPNNYYESLKTIDNTYCSGIRNVIASDQHLYFIYNCGNTNYQAIYSKNSGNLHSGRYAVSNYFFPFVIMSQSENKFVAYTKAGWVRDLINKGLVIPKYAKELTELSLKSNDPDEIMILLIDIKDF